MSEGGQGVEEHAVGIDGPRGGAGGRGLDLLIWGGGGRGGWPLDPPCSWFVFRQLDASPGAVVCFCVRARARACKKPYVRGTCNVC